MKSIKIVFVFLISANTLIGQPVNNYVPFTALGILRSDFTEVICLRKFMREGSTFFLTVSPQSLNTRIIRSDSIIIKPAPWEIIKSRYSSSSYLIALSEAAIHSDTLQDAGLTHFRTSQKGIDMTIDLCPSLHPLDRIVFTGLIKELGKVETPVPLAIAITGRWINRHPADLRWLDSLNKAGVLSIVWINHSYNHYTGKDVPLKNNFMLAPGIDINAEVLSTEVALLQKNIVPSVFFRFPGLVSDREIYERIMNLGLIPVGSDSWLSKGQYPQNGSIVLIHANGNDPVGVHDFLILLKNKRADILSKSWELFDLRESIVRDNSR